jgi:uncharacterized repeat protein (TIGR01451 family)
MKALSRLAAVGLAVGVGVAVGQPVPQPAPIIPASATDPLLRPEPAVALDWTGPAVVRVGKPNAYTLTVKNTSRGFVQQVTVQVRPPEGASVTDPKPAARVVDGVYLWDVGTLEPGEAKPLTLTLTGGKRGELACQAWVTFTGTAGMTVKVQEPKLGLVLHAPESMPLGESAEVVAVATNTGDCPLAEVRVETTSLNSTSPDGRAVDTMSQRFTDVGTGEARRGTLHFRPTTAGVHTLRYVARGSDGVFAEATHTLRVIAPALSASVAGPDKLLVGRKGTYTVTVKNTGELPVDGAALAVTLPAGLRSTTPDGRLTFPVGDLKPGDERTRTFEATAATAGVQPVTATATGSRGAAASAECRTAVDGVPALRVELVDLADPVEKGQETVYEIRLTNTGTKSDEAVTLAVEVPSGLRFVSATGPTGPLKPAGLGIPTDRPKNLCLSFDPVRELAPKTEAVYRVKVKATAAGDVRFKATVTSKHLTAPVVKEESTRVYGD